MEEKQTSMKKSKTFFQTASQRAESFCRVLVGKELQNEEERIASQKYRKELLFFALFGILSALFALTKLPLGISSLGYAFFAAAVGRHAVFSLIGLAVSLFWQSDPFVSAAVLLLGLLMRVLIKRASPSRTYFEESRRIRLALAAALGFLESFALSALSGFSKTSLIALAASAAASPIFALFFTLITLPKKEGTWREIGRLSIVFFAVYALDTVGLFGLSLGVILAMFLTLSIAITGGALRGVLMGLVSGLALGGPYAPIFAICGLCTGIGSNISLSYSVLASSVLSIAMNLYLQGPTNALFFTTDILFATLLFLPLAKAGLIPEIRFFADEPSEMPDMKYVEGLKRKFRQNKLEALSSAFEELSDVFLKLSEKSRRPGSYELEEVGDAVFSRYCRNCSLYPVCRGHDGKELAEAMQLIYKNLQNGEHAVSADLPESVGKRCRHLEKILRDINIAAAELVEKAIRRDKTELFALDYEAMAELLYETAHEGEDEFERDATLCKQASAALKTLGFSALGYSAFGKRQKTVLAAGVDITSLSVSGKEIARQLGETCGYRFSEPHFDFSGDFVTMTVTTLPRLSTKAVSACRAKEEGDISGDAVTFFSDARGIPHLLLCDGMGSGKTAAITARIATVFMEKMISAGNSEKVVLKMLSNFLRSKSEECHSTCDLLKIDIYAGLAQFTKCGAALSYLCHEGNLVSVDLRSLPIGITRDFLPASESLPLAEGDIVLLISDGVTVKEEELLPILTSDRDLQEKADAVLAAFAGDDDASVILVFAEGYSAFGA